MDDKQLFKMAMAGYNYDKIMDFVKWIIDLDTPGNRDRRSVTLNKIIQKARATRVDNQE